MNTIPRTFHTIKFDSAPNNYNRYIEASIRSQKKLCANTQRKHWYTKTWTEQDFLHIISQPEWHIPHGKKLLPLQAWAFMSDVIRLYALYTEGGVYADWDVEFIRNIPPSFFDYEVVLGFEPYTNAGRGTAQVGMQYCMSTPRHPIWKDVYTRLTELLWTEDFDILPGIVTHTLSSLYGLPHLRNNNNYYYIREGVVIMPKDIFYPFMGTRIEHNKDTTSIYDMMSAYAHTIALHWEHSHLKYNGKRQGWTKYLSKMRHPPS